MKKIFSQANQKKEKQSTRNKQFSSVSSGLVVLSICIMVFMIVSNLFTHNIMKDKDALKTNVINLREASQYLTSEVRAYSGSGDKTHYDNYMNEVEVAKNRDTAIENMKKIGLNKSELAAIQEIMDISNSLVPLEKNAMDSTEKGDKESALSYVYGEEYQTSINEIENRTAAFIENLEKRMDQKILTFQMIGFLIELFGFTALLAILFIQKHYAAFVKQELLEPVFAMQKQMESISNGILDEPFELQENDTEIGMLIHSINTTRNFLHSIINDLSEKLSLLAIGDFTFSVDKEYREDILIVI